MALITAQQLTNYYNQLANIDVTFTKEVIKVIRLRSKETFVRALGLQWPCIIYSSSMVGAKIIANVDSDFSKKVAEANDLVSLRFSFDQIEKKDPLTFFVSAKVLAYSEYSDSHPELNFVTLKYTQRPSDDLITILGTLLEANINAKRRKEERIAINPETLRKLGLVSKNAVLLVDDKPRQCIVRDLSFSGALLIISGAAETMAQKDVKLKLGVSDDQSSLVIPGKIVRFEEIPERKGIGSVALQFAEGQVPMDYKLRLNDYISTARKPETT
jgi:hypothetical protein